MSITKNLLLVGGSALVAVGAVATPAAAAPAVTAPSNISTVVAADPYFDCWDDGIQNAAGTGLIAGAFSGGPAGAVAGAAIEVLGAGLVGTFTCL